MLASRFMEIAMIHLTRLTLAGQRELKIVIGSLRIGPEQIVVYER